MGSLAMPAVRHHATQIGAWVRKMLDMKSDTYPNFSSELLNELLLSQARALVFSANGLARLTISLDDAISQTLAMLQNPPAEAISGGDLATRLDPQRLLLLTAGVSQISGKPIDSLMQPIFEAHPGVPCEFRFGKIFSIQALESFHRVVTHGEESGNGLLIPEFVVEDVARGAAFYAVKCQGCIAGEISLRLEDFKAKPRVEVEWVMGMNSADASPELSKLARSLADSWSTAQQLECWVGYARQCAEWWLLASDSGPQLPRSR